MTTADSAREKMRRLGFRVCSVNGCAKPPLNRGLCPNHYRLWLQAQHAPTPCAVDGCDSPAQARGWCSKHYTRWHQHGDVETVLERSGRPLSSDIRYSAAHMRVRKAKGSAALQPCIDCGEAALQWSYSGSCPSEGIEARSIKQGASVSVVSVAFCRCDDSGHYVARCRRCHIAHDRG